MTKNLIHISKTGEVDVLGEIIEADVSKISLTAAGDLIVNEVVEDGAGLKISETATMTAAKYKER